ncbi:uncharacterized protein LOC129859486 isoform X2 [Salvelinus fontinalis]|uniref:uncharacterized protein LOC129859486 isoform X2 n=1 Tax=Salvelinus fontinalis TaxID=8038 RepID=UPI0024852B1D|nr:uncharacterized protein LOC129859486 isoform X2 [Salvelinus fontinalis]
MSAQSPLLPLTSAGLPLYQSELASMADEALVVSMSQVNNLYAGLRLYRVTHGSVKRNLAIRPRGLTTADHVYGVEWFADVNVVNRVPHSGGCYFGIKETDCLKSSGEDPQRCALSGLLCAGHLLHHTSALCFRAHSGCGQNSSESSSEEVRERGCPIDEENRKVFSHYSSLKEPLSVLFKVSSGDLNEDSAPLPVHFNFVVNLFCIQMALLRIEPRFFSNNIYSMYKPYYQNLLSDSQGCPYIHFGS